MFRGDKNMYQKDALREYILNSEIRVFSKEIKVRLSKDLAVKYDEGLYQNALLNIQNNLQLIKMETDNAIHAWVVGHF